MESFGPVGLSQSPTGVNLVEGDISPSAPARPESGHLGLSPILRTIKIPAGTGVWELNPPISIYGLEQVQDVSKHPRDTPSDTVSMPAK